MNVGTTFRLVPFSTPWVHPNPQTGDRIGGLLLYIGIVGKWRQSKILYFFRGIGKSWVGFRLVHSPTLHTLLTSKIGNLRTPPLNYSQTAADGATL